MQDDGSRRRRMIVTSVVFVAVVIVLSLLSLRYLTLERVKEIALYASDFSSRYPLLVALALALSQGVSMTFSLPTKALLTVLAGALLGPWFGAPVTMIGVMAGTTVLFFGVRKVFRDGSDEPRSRRFPRLQERIKRRPVLAVAGLRLVITLPYGPITIASSLAGIGYRQFAVGSIIGDAPVVVLYCMAGQRLATMATTSEAVSPMTVIILAAAGVAILAGALAGGMKKED